MSKALLYSVYCYNVVLMSDKIPGTSSVVQRKWKSLQCSAQASGPGESVKVRTSAVSAEIKQVKSRRKTARMLMVVLFVFAICYLPISILNIMKRYLEAFCFSATIVKKALKYIFSIYAKKYKYTSV